MFDLRDIINVTRDRENNIRCVSCRGVAGFYHQGVVDLFKFGLVRQRNAFVGRRSICENVECENRWCPRYLLQKGIETFNRRYGLEPMVASQVDLNSIHLTLDVEGLQALNLQCVDESVRLVDRACLSTESINFDQYDAALRATRAAYYAQCKLSSSPFI